MGSHPVPSTKRKEEVVARDSRSTSEPYKKMLEEEEEVVVEEGGEVVVEEGGEVVVEEHETAGAKSWPDVVAAAGGLPVMKDVVVEDLQGGDGVGDQPAGPEGQVGVQPAGPEGEARNLPLVADAAKKKTPLQYRLEQPKRMAEEKISNSNKKNVQRIMEYRQVKI